MREQIDRGPAEQRERVHGVERLIDVRQYLREPERAEHDPGNHREVQVGVGSRASVLRSRPSGA